MLFAPEVGTALQGLGAAIRYRSSLTVRIREMAILPGWTMRRGRRPSTWSARCLSDGDVADPLFRRAISLTGRPGVAAFRPCAFGVWITHSARSVVF